MRTALLTSLAALGFGLWIGPAEAAIITYDWTGTVDVVDPGFPAGVTVGEKIGVTLTLDSSIPPDLDNTPNMAHYEEEEGQPPFVLSDNIGGNTDVGVFQDMYVLDNYQGVDEVIIETGNSMTGDGFEIMFKTDHPGALTSDAIPLSIDPADFETATFAVVRNPALGDFLPGFSGTIDAEVAVPEPSSLAIIGTVLLGLALVPNARRLNPYRRKGWRPSAALRGSAPPESRNRPGAD